MVFVLRCRFQWLTNQLTTFPFIPMVPIDHSFSHSLQVFMRCSLQMVYWLTEELTIRSNGTNRKASLTNRNLLPMVWLVVLWLVWSMGDVLTNIWHECPSPPKKNLHRDVLLHRLFNSGPVYNKSVALLQLFLWLELKKDAVYHDILQMQGCSWKCRKC